MKRNLAAAEHRFPPVAGHNQAALRVDSRRQGGFFHAVLNEGYAFSKQQHIFPIRSENLFPRRF